MTLDDTSVPRVEPLSVEDARAIGKEAGVPSSMSGLNVFRTLLRHPTLAGVVAGQLSMLLWKGNKLDPRLRELVIMRIGWRNQSEYEWTQHWHVARHLGISEADILAVRVPDKAPNLSEADLAVIAATDDTLNDGCISPKTWNRCAAVIGSDEEMVELVMAISNWRTFSELLRSLRIPLEDGIEAWPPDGKTPQSR